MLTQQPNNCSDHPGYREPPRLKGLNFSRAQAIQARDARRLLSIALFTTRLCNLRCSYCYISGGSPLVDELRQEEYYDIVLQAKDLGARTVWIPGAGEPLLQDRFRDLVDFIHRQGLWLVLFTNGTRLTPGWVRFLADRNVSVVVKCNSFRPDVQDLLAGRAGASQQIAAGRQLLLDAGFQRHRPTRLAIETVVCAPNLDEIPAIFTWAREHGIFPYIETLLESGRAEGNHELAVPPHRIRDLFHRLLQIDREAFGYDWEPSPPYVAVPCDKLLYNITVDSQGVVRPCCGIHQPLGNVREKPLAKFLAHPQLLRLRFPKENLHGACASCNSTSCLYGCRSQAETAGDLLGPCPSCWKTTTLTSLSANGASPCPAPKV